MEYALNLSPSAPEANATPTPSLVESGGLPYPAITFRRRTNAADLAYLPEVSGSLTTPVWTPLTLLHGTPLPLENGMESVTYRSGTPVTGSVRQYVRLRVTALRVIP